MRAALSLAIIFVSLALTACEENMDPATPEGALHTLRDAVMAKDTEAVLTACSKTTHATLAQLHTLLKAQRDTITTHYPEDHVAAAKTAFPTGVLEAKDGAALFAALLKAELAGQDATPGLRYGMSSLGAATVDGERATVPTQSGESLEFVLEEGRWKTTVFERALEQNLNRIKLNQQTLTENLKVFQELKTREEAKAKAKAAEEGSPEGDGPDGAEK